MAHSVSKTVRTGAASAGVRHGDFIDGQAMDLTKLSSFHMVAKHGGFTRAGRATGQSKTTLSRHVSELEESLGVRLVERGARDTPLTEEGRSLFERTASLVASIEEIADEIRAGMATPRGTLRISVPLLFAQVAMGRLAALFVQLHPHVQVKVIAEDRPVDLVDEGIDLVIRVNPPPDQILVGRRFLDDHLVVVAAPDLEQPSGGSAREPRPVRAIVLPTLTENKIWQVERETSHLLLAPDPILVLSSFNMVRDATLSGVGAAILPWSMAMHEVAAGRLVEWGRIAGGSVEIWVLYASRRLVSSKVSAFVQFLVNAFPEGSSEELAAMLVTPETPTRANPKPLNLQTI